MKVMKIMCIGAWARAGVLGASLVALGLAAAPSFAGGGDGAPNLAGGGTVGSLPSVDGGGRGDDARSSAARLTLRGPVDLVSAAMVESGPFTAESLRDGVIRVRFSPGEVVVLDEAVLVSGLISLGIEAPPHGGVRTLWAWDGSPALPGVLGPGAEMTLPVERMLRSRLLESGLVLHTLHATEGRRSLEFRSEQGLLHVRAD